MKAASPEVVVMEDKRQRYWPLPLRILLGIGFLVHGLPKLGAVSIRGMTEQGPQFGMPGMEVPLLYFAALVALAPDSRLGRPWRHREAHA